LINVYQTLLLCKVFQNLKYNKNKIKQNKTGNKLKNCSNKSFLNNASLKFTVHRSVKNEGEEIRDFGRGDLLGLEDVLLKSKRSSTVWAVRDSDGNPSLLVCLPLLFKYIFKFHFCIII
jgi:hypothetical protein